MALGHKPSLRRQADWILQQHCQALARRLEQVPAVEVLAALLAVSVGEMPESSTGASRTTPAGPDPQMARTLSQCWGHPAVERLLATLKAWESEHPCQNRQRP